jgi:hypothetical protein
MARSFLKQAGVIVVLLASGQAPGDETLKERLFHEGAHEWQILDEMGSKLEGTFTVQMSYEGVNKPSTTTRYRVAINGTMLKAVVIDEGAEARERGWAVNKDYLFAVGRAQGATDYGIQFLEPTRTLDAATTERVKAMAAEIKDGLHAPWFLLGRSLSDWLKEPGFKIQTVEPAEDIKLVRVGFEYHKTPNDPREWIAPGFFVVDPANHWTLRSYQARMWWGEIEAGLDYGEPVDSLPVVRKRSERWTGKDKTVMQKTLQIESIARKDVQEDQFRLPAFGLPEPNFQGEVGNRQLVLIGLAILCGVLAWAVRRRPRPASPARESPGDS